VLKGRPSTSAAALLGRRAADEGAPAARASSGWSPEAADGPPRWFARSRSALAPPGLPCPSTGAAIDGGRQRRAHQRAGGQPVGPAQIRQAAVLTAAAKARPVQRGRAQQGTARRRTGCRPSAPARSSGRARCRPARPPPVVAVDDMRPAVELDLQLPGECDCSRRSAPRWLRRRSRRTTTPAGRDTHSISDDTGAAQHRVGIALVPAPASQEPPDVDLLTRGGVGPLLRRVGPAPRG